MKFYSALLGAALALLVVPAARTQVVHARLVEPHDDAVTPMFLAEHSQNGFAVVLAEIGPDGKMGTGLPIALSHGDLYKYAVDAAKNWHYTAATANGTAESDWIPVPVFFPGDMTVTDDQLWPLVHACAYIYNGWLKTHGYVDMPSRLEARKNGLAALHLVRRPQTDRIMADKDGTDPRVKDAADLADKWIGGAAFPDKTLAILQHIGGVTIFLPVVGKKPAAQQP